MEQEKNSQESSENTEATDENVGSPSAENPQDLAHERLHVVEEPSSTFVVSIRPLFEPSSTAIQIEGVDGREALANALVVDVSGLHEPLMLWERESISELVALDIDRREEDAALTEAEVAVMFPSTLPHGVLK